jgi:signal transduction histidine kinase
MLPLESCKLFGSLAPADLAALKSVAKEIRFAGGAEIFKEGDAGDALYAIAAGAVQISGIVAQGERQIFSRLPAGEVFGEMAVIDNQPRSASALAEVETMVYRIPREAFLALLERSPQFSFSMMREITRRLREFNQQYLRTVLQAERMALVGRFANSIVHDLKNPLSIIGMAADLACQAKSTPESRGVAQKRIQKQVDRISTMVSDILEFTRGSHAHPTLAVLDYAEFAQPVIDEIAREVEPKGVLVQCAQPPPSVRVPINPRRLSRVFYNLMFNAVDELPEGGRIQLHFRTTPAELVTEIEDSGRGIAPQMLDKLFEAFATYGKARGTGLGLSITKRIVEEHNGRIYARNVPGGGALFGFTLPLQPPIHG